MTDVTDAAGARFEISDLLPDGKNLVQIEVDGETIMVVRRGEMSQALIDEVNAHLRHVTRNGIWVRVRSRFCGRRSGRPTAALRL